MKKRLKFALIGYGTIAKIHQEQLATIEEAELVAVAGRTEVKVRDFAERAGIDWYTDYHELLKRDDIDIVDITTPSGMHSEMTLAAARAGKHVIVEKPMDITLDKARAMINVCRDEGVKLAVIFQHRFDESTVRLKEAVTAGKLGKWVLGEAAVTWYRTQAYYDSAPWRGTWALDGGGALMNQSIHTIDLLQYIMGPVDRIYAKAATLSHERIEVEDVAVATLEFKNGALGSIIATTSAYPGFSAQLRVFGTEGTAIIDNDRLTNYFIKGENKARGAEHIPHNLAAASSHLFQPDSAKADENGAYDPRKISVRSHRLQLIDMIHAIKENREPLVNGEEGLKSLEIILAIYQSAQTGKAVSLPLH